MTLQIVDILNIIVVFQLGVFALFLFTRNTVPNRLLGIFLLSETIVLLNYLAANNPQMTPPLPREVYYFVQPFKLLWGPAFYFYVRSLIAPEPIMTKKLALHSLPFWLFVVILVLLIAAGTTPNPGLPASWELYSPSMRLALTILINGQITAYCIAAIWVFFTYRNSMKQSHSSLKLTNLSWLKFIVYGYCCAHIISMGSQALSIWTGQTDPVVNLTVYLGFFIFFNIIFYNAWTQPGIFSADEEFRKYKTSSLTAEESQRYIDELAGYMHAQKPYLNPELSLNEVAEALHIPQRHVSQVINERFGQNFFDFVNSYRVDEAKRALSDPESARKTVLEILYESGFNTKSSFYVAFKKNTGVAPKEFRSTALRVSASAAEQA